MIDMLDNNVYLEEVNVCPSVYKRNSLAGLVYLFKFEKTKYVCMYFPIVSTFMQ